ncbi:hypothetical protein BC827DRAFT_1156572 [Russula dissimulans]|nr:hypothetical protein BC827DRAFT_1156572 [Russula dissimulans]
MAHQPAAEEALCGVGESARGPGHLWPKRGGLSGTTGSREEVVSPVLQGAEDKRGSKTTKRGTWARDLHSLNSAHERGANGTADAKYITEYRIMIPRGRGVLQVISGDSSPVILIFGHPARLADRSAIGACKLLAFGSLMVGVPLPVRLRGTKGKGPGRLWKCANKACADPHTHAQHQGVIIGALQGLKVGGGGSGVQYPSIENI